MKKVFITRRFPDKFVKLIKDSGFSVEMWNSDEPVDNSFLLQKSKDIDGLICTLNDKIDEIFFNNANKLKIISTMSVGFDHIHLPTAKIKDIKIGYTPGVLTDATAELAIGLLLSVSRRLIEGAACVKNGSWGSRKGFWLCGFGLNNSSVGIVGLGSIGKAIARRLQPFGVKEFFACTSDNTKYDQKIQIEPNLSIQLVELDALLKISDFVIVACSLNDRTKNMFGESCFSLMKSNSIFINISRGGVVNQDSLLSALKEGKIAGAGLDVCTPEPLPVDHPLLTLDNCVILPHIGSATFDTRNAMCALAVNNLINGLLDQDMASELKF